MNIYIKLLFVILAFGGIVLIFFVSWFWRGLIIPMVVILLFDFISSLFRKTENHKSRIRGEQKLTKKRSEIKKAGDLE